MAGLSESDVQHETRISDLAVVETDRIGQNVTVHPFAVIREGVVIGNNVIIHPHVVIESGVTLGDNVEVFPGAYLGKVPKGAGATARTPEFERRIVIGESCSIGPHAVIYYDVVLGRNTLIGDGASIREKARIGDYCIISRYVTLNYNVTIGNRTKIMDLTHITGNTRIGDDVFISILVSTVNDNQIGKTGYSDEAIQGPCIENGVAVGSSANIFPAVTIGESAVVGASALVTKDVPPRKVVTGIPAVIKRDV